jgi:hypothetical protein
MKNKFEALKAFQSWPREWQELCAEFWAESDTTFEARLDAKQSEANPVGLVLPAIGDPWPYDEPMPVRRAAAKRPVLHFMRYTRDELGEIDFYLSNGGRPLDTARRMDKKHPGQRTVEAWEKMVHRVKKHGLEKMLENAIDMEVE